MTRITRKSVGKSEQYLNHKEKAQSLGEKADCAVRAIAVACNVPYETAHAKLCELGRRHGRATHTTEIRSAICELGGRVQEYSFKQYREMVAQYPGKHCMKQYITTHHPDRFPKVWRDGKTYLFFTRGHVLCIKDGVNHDWTRGRSMKVTHIWEIS